MVPDLLRRINAAFANTSAEVRAETERASDEFCLDVGKHQSVDQLHLHRCCLHAGARHGQHHEHGHSRTLSGTRRLEGSRISPSPARGLHPRRKFGLAFTGAVIGIGGAAISLVREMRLFPVFELTPRISALAFLIGGSARNHLDACSRLVGLSHERRRRIEDARPGHVASP